MNLTPKQLHLLDFVKTFINEHRYAPTLEEMAGHFNISTVTVFEHMRALERKGAIRRQKHKARSIEIIPQDASLSEPQPRLPLMGFIAAGQPVEALESDEAIDFADLMRTDKQHFVLQVRGTSMIDEQIQDGDYVIAEQRDWAENGETVVALVDEYETTLKKYYREKGRIRLQPANSQMDPIYAEPDNVEVQGKVIAVIRQMT